MKFEYREIPDTLKASAGEWRQQMVEAAAEATEALTEKYLNTGDLSAEDIVTGLRLRTIATEIQPMLCGSAFKNRGVQRLLDAIVELMPSPLDVPAIEGHSEDDSRTLIRHASDDEKFAALAFKLMTDPFVGQLTFVRVYSGVLAKGDLVYNPTRGKRSA